MSKFAVQLSWSFSFFPPDRFLILWDADIDNPELTKYVDNLNNIQELTGVASDVFKLPDHEEMHTPSNGQGNSASKLISFQN